MRLKSGVLSLLLAASGWAQTPAAAPGVPGQTGARGIAGGRPPAIRSAEILDDHKVTFRLRAPEATNVIVNGDWPEGRGLKMTKDEAGIWSATVGPLTSELWAYTFNVDGASLPDPANPNLLRDGTRYSSFLIIDGPIGDKYKIKDVPHGNVSQVWYDSPTLGTASPRRLYVYTPPGYEKGTQKYPALYLLHGAGGDEDAWNNMGRTSVIMDNLLAAGKIRPMLVVMTNGNANQKMAPGYGIVPGQLTGNTGNPGEVGVVGRAQAVAAQLPGRTGSARRGWCAKSSTWLEASAARLFPRALSTTSSPISKRTTA